MNTYKTLVEFEFEGVKQEVGAEVQMEAEVSAPLVEAGNLELVPAEKTEEELAAESKAAEEAEAKKVADEKAAEEAAAAAKAEEERVAAEEAAAKTKADEEAAAVNQGQTVVAPRAVEVLDGKGKAVRTFTAEKDGENFIDEAKKYANVGGFSVDLKG